MEEFSQYPFDDGVINKSLEVIDLSVWFYHTVFKPSCKTMLVAFLVALFACSDEVREVCNVREARDGRVACELVSLFVPEVI